MVSLLLIGFSEYSSLIKNLQENIQRNIVEYRVIAPILEAIRDKDTKPVVNLSNDFGKVEKYLSEIDEKVAKRQTFVKMPEPIIMPKTCEGWYQEVDNNDYVNKEWLKRVMYCESTCRFDVVNARFTFPSPRLSWSIVAMGM